MEHKQFDGRQQGSESPRLYPTPDMKMNTKLCTQSISYIWWGRCETIRVWQFHHLQLLIGEETLM